MQRPSARRPRAQRRLTAVLGPTNTGKTHLAVERMLGHATGMIGFPLRLLARENYDRIVSERGRRAVALITGEEKIIPANPAYFICTVESMPVQRPVAFLAVDEIQLAADPERGHVFTDRLLHARGREETMFLGSDTIAPFIRRLLPDATFDRRPRFSKLSYTGPRKITRLPRRSAIVAFSVADVYAIAETLRRQRGGTAVVLGALSPRTRNAQVALYQEGEVDYLVATDAIGMGLNMNLDHVALSAMRKFDGRASRPLTAAEIGQIAGRAGRYMNDGTFGTTSEAGALDADIVAAIENHRFDPVPTLYWRNPELSFANLPALIASLEERPPIEGLTQAGGGDDLDSLAALARNGEIARRARGPAAIRLLWDVCQIPDFRKIISEAHTHLLAQIFLYLAGPGECLPNDWVAAQIARLDRTDGDIDSLTARIAHIRTWTFIAHRAAWLDDSGHWQARTRAIEDRLSDALHERLTQRFVDRRTATLVRRIKEGGALLAAVDAAGEVTVEGESLGRLEGFRFNADRLEASAAEAAVRNAAIRALAVEIERRRHALSTDSDAAFALTAEGRILWRDEEVGRLAPGADPADPRAEPLSSELLQTAARVAIRRRLNAWLRAHVAARLRPLERLRRAKLDGAARGIAYQLTETLGTLPRRRIAAQIAALTRPQKAALARLGVRFGRDRVYLPALLKPAAIELRTLLWAIYRDWPLPLSLPPAGRVSVPLDGAMPDGFYDAAGYRVLGPRALRLDIAEKLAYEARKLARQGPFAASTPLLSLAACGAGDFTAILVALGYRAVVAGDSITFVPAKPRGTGHGKGRSGRRKTADSPFAALGKMRFE